LFYLFIYFSVYHKLGIGSTKTFTRSSLKSGELIVCVGIKSFEYESNKCRHYATIPKSLTNAWHNHMSEYNVDDVEFDIEGKKFYVCSSIIARRSDYFQNMLSGNWSETLNIQNNEKSNDINQDDKGKFAFNLKSY
jgi:hypothetical protein